MISNSAILFVIRVILGITVIYYGWPKIKNLKSNASDFVKMGFQPGMFWGTLIAIVEFFGGIAILLGLYAELAASLVGFQMIVGTFWKLKIKKPFTDYSYDLQLIALCLTIMSFGPGLASIASFDAQRFLRWDIGLGVVALGGLLSYFSKPKK